MDLEILKNEEKRMNLIMSVFLAVIPVVAFLYVLLFNGGTFKDAIALIISLGGLLTKAFEKVLGKFAKYVYISVLPVLGAIVIVLGTPGCFGAMVEAYFLVLFLSVPYYNLSMIKVCSIATIVPNVIAICTRNHGFSPDCHEGTDVIPDSGNQGTRSGRNARKYPQCL